MMTGEFEYVELMYPETETIEKRESLSSSPLGKNFTSWGNIHKEIDYNHFPGLSHLAVLGFIIFVGVVMMNLLVAIAVNDIKQLSKTAKRDQLMSQAELINYMERILGFWVFRKLLPSKIQDLFKARVLNRGRGFTMTREVFYANNNDRSLPEPLKNELYDFCMKYLFHHHSVCCNHMFVSGLRKILERVRPRKRKRAGEKLWKINMTNFQISVTN